MGMTTILFIGGAIGAILLVVGIIISATSERALVEERIGKYVEDEISDFAQGETSTPLTDWVNVQVEQYSWGDQIAKTLAQADLKLKPAEYMAAMLIAMIAVGALAWFFGGRNIVSGLIGVIIGFTLPRMYVTRQKNQRLTRFDEQLPDMLNLMVNGLRAGFSTMQAMEAVSKELPAPISIEFLRVVQEMQIGISMEDALDNLLRRIPSDDLDLIIAAMNVQREVGGNLAEILDTISFTIRERVRIKGEIKVLTAQVMYSGRFLSLLPIILAGALWFVNRDYMMKFFEPGSRVCGLIMLSIAAVMVASGYFAMTRLADIDI